MTSIMANRFENIQSRLVAEKRFASVEYAEGIYRCQALEVESPAFYIIEPLDTGFAVMFATPDRWLNESIEADLVHTGDDIAELIEEEYLEADDSVEQVERPVVKHYRSDDLLYTFRSEFIDPGAEGEDDLACAWLLAYEAAFSELGDMGGPEED